MTAGVDVGTTGVRWAVGDVEGRVWPVAEAPARAKAVAALPADEAIFRILELPPLSRREVGPALRWELQRVLPFPVDDGVFDYVALGPEARGAPGARRDGGSGSPRRRYAVAGGLADAIERRLTVLQRLGIRPSALEPEWVTLWRLALDLSPRDGTVCGVVDLGAAGTRVLVVDGSGVPVAFYRSPVGGRDLDRELSAALGVAPEEAEQLKMTELASDLGPLASGGSLVQLAGELARALRRVQQEVRPSGLELWAVGGGAAWAALRDALGEALGMELRLPGTPEAAARSPVGALEPRWVLAGELARWHWVRRAGPLLGRVMPSAG